MSHHTRTLSRRVTLRGGLGLAAGLALTGRIAPGAVAQDPTRLTLGSALIVVVSITSHSEQDRRRIGRRRALPSEKSISLQT